MLGTTASDRHHNTLYTAAGTTDVTTVIRELERAADLSLQQCYFCGRSGTEATLIARHDATTSWSVCADCTQPQARL
jgi:hypothetical protein